MIDITNEIERHQDHCENKILMFYRSELNQLKDNLTDLAQILIPGELSRFIDNRVLGRRFSELNKHLNALNNYNFNKSHDDCQHKNLKTNVIILFEDTARRQMKDIETLLINRFTYGGSNLVNNIYIEQA